METKSEEVIDESKPFEFVCEGVSHNAYVRYYDNGDVDMEITSDDNPSEKAYEQAWVVAESLGLLRKLPHKPEVLNTLMAWNSLLKSVCDKTNNLNQ
jgi:hypothetical protein